MEINNDEMIDIKNIFTDIFLLIIFLTLMFVVFVSFRFLIFELSFLIYYF